MAIYVTAHIGDIHFGNGSIKPEIMYDNLDDYFYTPLKNVYKLDILFIQGDVYHKILSLNSAASFYVMKHFKKVFKLAEKRGFAVRVIKGTDSHDEDQLEIIKILADRYDIDFKYINTVKTENLRGLDVLYLPEEYVKNTEEYYEPYFNNHYDYIIGHGMFDKTSFSKAKETNFNKAPIFNSKEMSKRAEFISFSHIHDAVSFCGNIYYTGSFVRFCQGEENPKGFLFNIYDSKTGNFKVCPIVNEDAKIFTKVNITKELRKGFEQADLKIRDKLLDNVFRLEVNCESINDSEFLANLKRLKEKYNDNSISFNITQLDISNAQEKEKELVENYSYLFDDTLDEADKISIFIAEDLDTSMSPEEIEYLLDNDITDIINNT